MECVSFILLLLLLFVSNRIDFDNFPFICAAVDHLVDLQNNFLKEVLSIAPQSGALLSLKRGEQFVIRSCPINELNKGGKILIK